MWDHLEHARGLTVPAGSARKTGDGPERTEEYGVEVDTICPECGAPGIPLVFGLPGPEARQAAENGQLALGGCLVPAEPPSWQCPRQHRWHHTDEEAWKDRILAVLVAHGYSVDVG